MIPRPPRSCLVASIVAMALAAHPKERIRVIGPDDTYRMAKAAEKRARKAAKRKAS